MADSRPSSFINYKDSNASKILINGEEYKAFYLNQQCGDVSISTEGGQKDQLVRVLAIQELIFKDSLPASFNKNALKHIKEKFDQSQIVLLKKGEDSLIITGAVFNLMITNDCTKLCVSRDDEMYLLEKELSNPHKTMHFQLYRDITIALQIADEEATQKEMFKQANALIERQPAATPAAFAPAASASCCVIL